MLAQERYNEILNIINKEGSVKVSMLTKLFDVSIETIRRDLEHLEKKGLLKRVYGGAILEKPTITLSSFRSREKEFLNEKKEIAAISVNFISEKQSIAMDSSTTNLEIVKLLKHHFKELTIITNSILIAQELSDTPNFTVILLGGKLVPSQYCLVGSMTLKNITNFFADIAFISTSGISLKSGITDYNINDVDIQKNMIELSKITIVLADHSKFDKTALIKVADFEDVNLIISDSKLSDSIIKRYKNNGIEIINK